MKHLRLFFAPLLFLLVSPSVLSQTQGTWSGFLSVQGSKLTLVLHIDNDKCSLDSPDQNAKGIPATLRFISEDSVNIDIPVIGAAYQAKLIDSALQGNFTQRGYTFPLTLRRGETKHERPQTPRPPFPYTTENVNFYNPDDGAMLSGSLSLPEHFSSDTPVLLMITGSGLQNRDEELFGHKPFFVIADHLARHGIATLRYDDRGTAYSTGNVKQATTETFFNDALAGIRCLRDRGYTNVGALGHSEGGTIALLLAARKQIDFAVTLAATATNGCQTLKDQNRALLLQLGMSADTVNAYCDALEQVLVKTVQAYQPGQTYPVEALIDSLPQTPLLSQDQRTNLIAVARQVEQQAWMRHFITLDYKDDLKAIRCPVLALNGEHDLQVIAGPNLAILKPFLKKNKRSKIVRYPQLNHLFQTCQTGLPDEYSQIEETIAQAVLEDIVRWIISLK